jgi:hypothetical protein
LRGTSEFTRARELLKAVYRVRNGFSVVRHPGVYAYEYPEGMRDTWGHLKEEHRYEGSLHVYGERWKVLAAAFEQLEEQNLEAEVEWGSHFRDVIVPLRRCRIDLGIAIREFLEQKKPGEDRPERDQKSRDDRFTKLYEVGTGSEQDSFTPQILAAIKKFEEVLEPKIRK